MLEIETWVSHTHDKHPACCAIATISIIAWFKCDILFYTSMWLKGHDFKEEILLEFPWQLALIHSLTHMFY